MLKQQFMAGDSVSPEWLNASQNLSYDKSSEEVGHLPLPPDYNNKQQWKTFSVTGGHASVDLGDWNRNAIISVKGVCDPSTDTMTWPSQIDISSHELTGCVFIIPDLKDGDFVINYAINSRNVTKTLKNGEIAIVYSFDNGEFIVPRFLVVPSNVLGRFNSVDCASATFTLNDTLIATISSSNNNGHTKLTFDVESIDFNGSLKASSITFGDSSNGPNAELAKKSDRAILSIRNGNVGAQRLSFDSSNGSFSVGHSFTEDVDDFNCVNAEVSLVKEHRNSTICYKSKILMNKSINDDLDEYECVGVICILYIDSSPNPHADSPTKCEITSSSIKFYTHDGSQWVENQ